MPRIRISVASKIVVGVLSGVGRRSKTLRAAIEANEERDELVEQIEI
eukprot:COSAG01_NODE_669_length_14379_cov_292.353011_1_plen_46_part_10